MDLLPAKVIIKKKKFEMGEPIEVLFEVNTHYDSLQFRGLNDFELVGTRDKNLHMTRKNGVLIYTETRRIRFTVPKKGKYEIQSPLYFKGKESFEAEPAKIRVVKERRKT